MFRIPRLRTPRAAEHRGRRSVGWLATAVAICLVALLAVPLIRELGTNGRGNAPAQLPAQTRNVQLGPGGAGNVAGASRAMTPGTGGDNSQGLTAPVAAGVGQDMTPPSVATQAVPPADGGILAPPSTVIATMPPNLTVAARVSVADPHELLFQLKQNNGISYGWEDRYRTDATGTRAYHVIPWTPVGDTDLSGSVGGVEIVQDGQGDRPLAGYIVFARPEKAAQRLAEIEQTPGLVMAKTRVDQYDGVIVLNNDRVITIVQVGNVLVIGSAWTDENDWVSTEDDLQAFKWQSLKETISAIAYLDHVVSAYQGHR